MDSVIGMKRDKAIQRFLTLIPSRNEPASENIWLHGVLVSVDMGSGRSLGIERLSIPVFDE